MAPKFLDHILLLKNIDVKSIIHLSDYDEDNILVTGSQFVKRFHIPTTKQINSWKTKIWDKFTSGAIRESQSDYIIAVTNQLDVIRWAVDDADLEKSETYTFKTKIHQLLVSNDRIYILFTCGSVIKFTQDCKANKLSVKPLIGEKEKILQAKIINQNTLNVVTHCENGEKKLYKIDVKGSFVLTSYILEEHDSSITGICILSCGNILTSWYNGNIHNHYLEDGSQFPGELQGNISSSIDATKQMNMVEVSSTHATIFGQSSTEEGGHIVLWDAKFGLSVDSKSTKMYCSPPLGWSVQNGVSIVEGGSVGFIYLSIKPSSVAMAFGSKKTPAVIQKVSTKCAERLVLSKSIRNVHPKNVSDAMRTQTVLSSIVDESSIKYLQHFLQDPKIVSEDNLVSILKLFLAAPDETFNEINKSSKKLEAKKTSKAIEKTGELGDRLKGTKGVENPFCENKLPCINAILSQALNKSYVLPQLRSIGLSNCVNLLKYLLYLSAPEQYSLRKKENNGGLGIERVSLWMAMLLDVFYSQMIISADREIRNVVQHCHVATHTCDKSVELASKIQMEMSIFQSRKRTSSSNHSANYNIEIIKLC